VSETIQSLLKECSSYGGCSAEYFQKMMHDVPEAPVVDRVKFILAMCRTAPKQVLNLGSSSGDLAAQIISLSPSAVGVDKLPGPFTTIDCDLDECPQVIKMRCGDTIGLVVAGEILEHLANPGRLLQVLRDLHCPVVITVPNAFSDVVRQTMINRHRENVNIDHVAWYSYRTMKTLIERYGFTIREWAWYKGLPLTAEGLIFVVE